MRIHVETGGFTEAGQSCAAANQVAAMACDSLSGKLAGFAAMAGDDSTSVDFATSYDAAAAEAVASLADLADAFTGVGRLLQASGLNHDRAEVASAGDLLVSSYAGGVLPDEGFVRVFAATPPSALGAGVASGLGDTLEWILDHLEGALWPGADTDRLRDAAHAWRSASSSVASIVEHCDLAMTLLDAQLSPEVPLAQDAVARLRDLVTEASDQLGALADACEEYAAQVEATRELIKALLEEIAQIIVEGVVISVVVGAITAGTATTATSTATMLRIAERAPTAKRHIEALIKAAREIATRADDVAAVGRRVRDRLVSFARARARTDHGSMQIWPDSPQWVSDVIRRLPRGNSGRHRVVATEADLRLVFDDLIKGARPVDPGSFPGIVYQRADDTIVRLRSSVGQGVRPSRCSPPVLGEQ